MEEKKKKFNKFYKKKKKKIHEMVAIEKGGRDQFLEEVAAYNPMIPKGNNLVATLMFEIINEEKRKQVLSTLGYVENQVCITFPSASSSSLPKHHDVVAVPISEGRTDSNGRTSAIHFLTFPFTEQQVLDFKKLAQDTANKNSSGNNGECGASIRITHPKYPHSVGISSKLIQSLASDFFP